MFTQIEREKYKIYSTFMVVPLTVIKKLSQQAQQRLESLRLLLDSSENNEMEVNGADNAEVGVVGGAKKRGG